MKHSSNETVFLREKTHIYLYSFDEETAYLFKYFFPIPKEKDIVTEKNIHFEIPSNI